MTSIHGQLLSRFYTYNMQCVPLCLCGPIIIVSKGFINFGKLVVSCFCELPTADIFFLP